MPIVFWRGRGLLVPAVGFGSFVTADVISGANWALLIGLSTAAVALWWLALRFRATGRVVVDIKGRERSFDTFMFLDFRVWSALLVFAGVLLVV
jgi:hypothetical protein